MATTFTKIASVTVGSGGASSIDFTSIPGTYTDLYITLSTRVLRTATNWSGILVKPNGTNFSATRQLYGTGSATASSSVDAYTGGASNSTDTTSNTFSNNYVYIPNYTSSDNKSISTDSVTENNATSALATLAASTFTVTSAITSIAIVDEGSRTFQQYTTATLYGIKNS
jgi:hypothetical protein